MIRLMSVPLSLLLLVTFGASGRAAAQVTIAHDTLGSGSAVAITCGFCATERYGVVFRELPMPARGIQPSDFPLTLRSVLVAVANARVTGSPGAYVCGGEDVAGEASVDVEVWAGAEAVSGSIRDLPADGAWNSSENLVWVGVDVPLTRSAAEAPGTPRYPEATFNELLLEDELAEPLVIGDGATYVRVVITLNADGTERSASCSDASNQSPAAFPMRDADAVVAPERSFGYALGVGWFWNEDPPFNIGGDWAIRLSIAPSDAPPPDAGVVDAGATDAGTDGGSSPTDSGAPDAGAPDVGADAGEPAEEGGCTLGGRPHWPAVPLVLLALAFGLRRRRRD